MPYAPVIPSTWDPTRQALNDMLAAILAGFMAVVPNVVRRYWSELPQALDGEHPFVYQGQIHEQIHHDAGTRKTVYTGFLGYVDVFADPEETNSRQNTFADYMREVFTANARISVGASGTGGVDGILEQTALIDGPTELTQGSAHFTDMRLDFMFTIQEGRN